MARECDEFLRAEALCRTVLSAEPEPTPGASFTGRVMAHVRDASRTRLEQRFFLRVAARIMLAGGCLAGLCALALIRGYAELNIASLAEAMAGATGLHILVL
jgi:hypothetical protein